MNQPKHAIVFEGDNIAIYLETGKSLKEYLEDIMKNTKEGEKNHEVIYKIVLGEEFKNVSVHIATAPFEDEGTE